MTRPDLSLRYGCRDESNLTGDEKMTANLSKKTTKKALMAAYEQILRDWYLGHIDDEQRAERKARVDAEWEAAGLS